MDNVTEIDYVQQHHTSAGSYQNVYCTQPFHKSSSFVTLDLLLHNSIVNPIGNEWHIDIVTRRKNLGLHRVWVDVLPRECLVFACKG